MLSDVRGVDVEYGIVDVQRLEGIEQSEENSQKQGDQLAMNGSYGSRAKSTYLKPHNLDITCNPMLNWRSLPDARSCGQSTDLVQAD